SPAMSAERLPAELVALLAACKAQWADDTPRLILADWLEEHGQPDRAEFIRLQLRRARLPGWGRGRRTLDRRIRELEARHRKAWLAGLPEHRMEWDLRRGLVWGSLEVLLPRDPLAEVARRSAWPWVEGLGVTWPRDAGRRLRALLASPHLSNLASLDL